MTVIATPERAVALAGVMGGENSEVTEETTCVLLESAAFERGRTSRTSRNLGLISEASMRYERGVDDHLCEVVSQAAAALLAECPGARCAPGWWTSTSFPPPVRSSSSASRALWP